MSPKKKAKKDKKSKKEKKSKKGRPQKEVASLYVHDIGIAGIKRTGLSNAPSISIQETPDFQVPLTEEEEIRRQKRMARFASHHKRKSPEDDLNSALSTSRKVSKKKKKRKYPTRVVGTSNALEKPYLRLTTFPRPEDVRPFQVLMKSLAHIKKKFIKTEDFEWANEQLKSLRQDLTVQGIRNNFVLEVYETHARILLENGDLQEFNQCQTMIRNLTSSTSEFENLGHNESNDALEDMYQESEEDSNLLHQTEQATDEFLAYRILYNLVQDSWGDLSRSLALGYEYFNSTNARSTSFQHALGVVNTILHNDFLRFFQLYEKAPHLSAYLMDFLVRRVRNFAYERIISSYRPSLEMGRIKEMLLFQTLDETRKFLKDNDAIFTPFWLDCKATMQKKSKK